MIAPIVCETVNALRLTFAACDAKLCMDACKELLISIASRCPAAFDSAYLTIWSAFARTCFSDEGPSHRNL